MKTPKEWSDSKDLPVEPQRTFAEILRDEQAEDQEVAAPVNIGLNFTVPKKTHRERAHDAAMRAKVELAARQRQLHLPPEAVREGWQADMGPVHTRQVAEHYGVFQDLFGDGAFFYPVVPLTVAYEYDEEHVTPVYRGNMVPPAEAQTVPLVEFEASEGELYTILMTNPDSHLTDNSAQYLHWMVANIPGDDVSSGETLCDYLRPFPPAGTGFHRHIFVLFKQTEKLDLSSERRSANCTSLKERTFKTNDFYRSHESSLTPVGLAFFQSEWDPSVRDTYHNILDMREPSFEYMHPPPYHPLQDKYPAKEPFDRYYDRYRCKKDLAEEVLVQRLENLSPFKPYTPRWKYPLVHLATEKKPTWLKRRENLMHRGQEQFRHINNS